MAFRGAVDSFCTAALHHDEDAQRQALSRMRDEFAQASEEEVYDAASLLADVLNSVPQPRDAQVAIVIGACVERGADAAGCAEPVLHRAQMAIEGAADFCRRWPLAAEDADYPEPTEELPPDELYAPFGGREDPGARAAVTGWWTLPLWEPVVGAMLGRKDVRMALLPRPAFLADAVSVRDASGAGAFLVEALAVLDDEPLIVLDRTSEQGFEFTMSGIADNFQLHTLLAERLVTPGHLPGEPPSPEAVAACRGETPEAPCGYEATGSFNLVAADGTWLWNEGIPADIPVVDGARLLVLDPPPYERSWSAARAFAGMAADLVLDRRLSADGVRHWMANVSPAVNPFPDQPAAEGTEPVEQPRRHWWKRGSAQTE